MINLFKEFQIKKEIILLCFIILNLNLSSQSKRIISGSVYSATTNEALSFVSISLKKQLVGNLTNEEGKFNLQLPEEFINYTLVINYLGYKLQLIPLKFITAPLVIKLNENMLDIKEIIVRPQEPDYYIRMAMRSIPINYPNKPFQIEAYYLEKILENENVIMCNEGIFKTYYPNYIDTIKPQNQLLLFRQTENLHELSSFIGSELKKEAERKKRKGKDTTSKDASINDLTNIFSGPETILLATNITRKSNNFLDTNKLKSYHYTFAKSSSYNSSELITINFESKGKIEHVRESGKIYIDLTTLAIVKIEIRGVYVIPALIRPILFLYGVGIENPDYESKTEYRQIKGKWYPSISQNMINLNLTKKHWFKPNEHSDFKIEQVFGVNKTLTESVNPISIKKRFNPKQKNIRSQVFNDENLKWEEVNIIK
jgi:hypothetical protein